MKHLTSQKNSAREHTKHELPVILSPQNPALDLHPALFPPANIFSPSHSKSATARHSAETPPYATIETVHSSLLSSAGCSEQLLQTGRPFFISHLVVWGERRRGPQRASHTFLPPSPLDCRSFLRRTCTLFNVHSPWRQCPT